MSDIQNFLIEVIMALNLQSFTVDSLAERYVIEKLGISKESIDFSAQVDHYKKKIIQTVKTTNSRFEKDGLEVPFLVKGSCGNLIGKGEKLGNLNVTLDPIEKAHDFAERVGAELLIRIGCKPSDIVITPRTVDNGIDYWGKISYEGICSNPPHEALVIGQVKKYSDQDVVPVASLREFVGAVQTALATKFFGPKYNQSACVILQFVTTGEITKAGLTVAKNNNIHVISSRHLMEMGILRGSY